MGSIARHESGLAVAASISDNQSDVVDHLEAEYKMNVDSMRAYFESGVTATPAWRKDQLNQLRKGLKECTDEIIDALRVDLGRPTFEGLLAEVTAVVQELDFALEHVDAWMKPEKVWHPMLNQPGSSYRIPQPKGVVLILSPWNYPINLCFMVVVAAIVSGNCSIIKPSEVTPTCSMVTEKLVKKYLDNRAFQVVQGAVPETTALLRNRFDHIVYTGNGAVGRIVASQAAKHLTPITLELGGKSPAIVDKSVNLKVAAKRLINGKFFNNGQTCIAPDYVLLHKDVEAEFLDELKSVLKSFFGDDALNSTSVGRIVNERHFDRIMRLLQNHDGIVISEGTPDRSNKFIPPTLVLNPNPDSDLMHEEIFGPVLPILTVNNAEDAVRFISARERPLALYIFAEDQAVCDQILAGTTSGGVCVNDCLFHITNPYLPFGGVGASGMGSYHGEQSFKELSHMKSVMYRSTWMDPGFRYPPYNEKLIEPVKSFTFSEGMSSGQKNILAAASAGALGLGVLMLKSRL